MSPSHNLSFCACKTAWFAAEWQVYMGSNLHLCFFSCKRATFWPDLQDCMGCRPHLWFLHENQQLLDRNCMSLWVLELTCDILHAKTVPSIRITSLYGSQSSSVVFAFKTATFGAELQVFMGPRHDLSFCAYKTTWLTSELLVSMSPISYVWFLDAKQRLLDRNNKSLWVPDINRRCVHENSVIRTRISSLYVSQTSSVVLSTHNCVLNTKKKDYIGSSRHLWFCACKTATLGLELQVSAGE